MRNYIVKNTPHAILRRFYKKICMAFTLIPKPARKGKTVSGVNKKEFDAELQRLYNEFVNVYMKRDGITPLKNEEELIVYLFAGFCIEHVDESEL